MYYLFFPQLVSSKLLHYLLQKERKDYMLNRSNLKLIQNVKETNNKRNKAKSFFAKKFTYKNLYHLIVPKNF